MEPAMPASRHPPYSPDKVADARLLVANPQHFLRLAPDDLAEALDAAWAILRADLAFRRSTAAARPRHAFPEDAA
jgi:hypothetical protein